jgi:Tfp pilus assembly protein PilN
MVKSFTINLNKGEGEAVVRMRRQERRSYLVLGLFALVFLVLAGLTWAQNGAMNDVIKSRQSKLSRIRFELDSLKREATKVSKDDVLALARLENERFLWARRLEKLGEIMPQAMSLTGLTYQNRVFTINAIAQVDTGQKEFDIISKFIELLKSTPEFRQGLFEIRFDQSLRKKIEGEDVLQFSVQCLTQDPERKAKARAAAQQSGGSATGDKITRAASQAQF